MWKWLASVVNCFQISIFAYHKQSGIDGKGNYLVVNCFQISIFAYHKQSKYFEKVHQHCCELLSN